MKLQSQIIKSICLQMQCCLCAICALAISPSQSQWEGVWIWGKNAPAWLQNACADLCDLNWTLDVFVCQWQGNASFWAFSVQVSVPYYSCFLHDRFLTVFLATITRRLPAWAIWDRCCIVKWLCVLKLLSGHTAMSGNISIIHVFIKSSVGWVLILRIVWLKSVWQTWKAWVVLLLKDWQQLLDDSVILFACFPSSVWKYVSEPHTYAYSKSQWHTWISYSVHAVNHYRESSPISHKPSFT